MYLLKNVLNIQRPSSTSSTCSKNLRIITIFCRNISIPPIKYQPPALDNIENIEDYRPGGFHPIHLNDSFSNGRYRIVHKLGYGGFSTVWLTRDTHLQRLVSLKVIKSEISSRCKELNILQHIESFRPRDHQCCSYILTILDTFTIHGPNGSHICLISEFAGPSLQQISLSPGQPSGSRRLRGELARKLAKQLAMAVKYLHSREIVHGDLTTSNILLQLSDQTKNWSDRDIYGKLGQPITEKVQAAIEGDDVPKSGPSYLVEPLHFSDLHRKYFSEKILLIDFDQSFLLRSLPVDGVGTPIAYSSPEAIFDRKAGIKSDIWALGSTIFEIRAGTQLFASFFGGPNEILRQMVQTLGKLPEPWWNSWEQRKMYFDDDGKPKTSWVNNITLAVEYPLTQQVTDIGAEDDQVCSNKGDEDATSSSFLADGSILEPLGTRLTQGEAQLLEDLIGRIVRYDQDERLPTEEIIRHPWFSKGG